MRAHVQHKIFDLLAVFTSSLVTNHIVKMYINLGSDVRKPVCGVSDQVRLKPVCAAKETS